MLCIAGGYGLFLKQQFLLTQSDERIVIPFENWRDAAPRATRDSDLILGLDLIANVPLNKDFLQQIYKHGFEDSDNTKGLRWQFLKKSAQGETIALDLHAKTPSSEQQGLITQGDQAR